MPGRVDAQPNSIQARFGGYQHMKSGSTVIEEKREKKKKQSEADHKRMNEKQKGAWARGMRTTWEMNDG
jgi:hypothetical protein